MSAKGKVLLSLMDQEDQQVFLRELSKHGRNRQVQTNYYTNIGRMIDASLTWVNTSQGHSFWNAMNIKYNQRDSEGGEQSSS